MISSSKCQVTSRPSKLNIKSHITYISSTKCHCRWNKAAVYELKTHSQSKIGLGLFLFLYEPKFTCLCVPVILITLFHQQILCKHFNRPLLKMKGSMTKCVIPKFLKMRKKGKASLFSNAFFKKIQFSFNLKEELKCVLLEK